MLLCLTCLSNPQEKNTAKAGRVLNRRMVVLRDAHGVHPHHPKNPGIFRRPRWPRPRYGCGSKWKTDVGPQMWMSSLVLTIQLLRYLILTHTLIAMLILRLTTRYKPADQAVYSLEFPYEKNTTECVRHRLLRSSCPGPRPEISRTGACTSGDHANRETVTTGVGDFWYSTGNLQKRFHATSVQDGVYENNIWYMYIWLHMHMGQNLVTLVNIKIAGKWIFIPLKMVLIGIDP